MAKHDDECDNCGSTESKKFWSFKDGSTLCDECCEMVGDRWEHRTIRKVFYAFTFSLVLWMMQRVYEPQIYSGSFFQSAAEIIVYFVIFYVIAIVVQNSWLKRGLKD
jgi:hypothetical protein